MGQSFGRGLYFVQNGEGPNERLAPEDREE